MSVLPQVCVEARKQLMNLADECLIKTRDMRHRKAMIANVREEHPEGFEPVIIVKFETTAFDPRDEERKKWSAEAYFPIRMFFNYDMSYDHKNGFKLELKRTYDLQVKAKLIGFITHLDEEVHQHLTNN